MRQEQFLSFKLSLEDQTKERTTTKEGSRFFCCSPNPSLGGLGSQSPFVAEDSQGMEVSLTLLVKKHAQCQGMAESKKEATGAKQRGPGRQAPSQPTPSQRRVTAEEALR